MSMSPSRIFFIVFKGGFTRVGKSVSYQRRNNHAWQLLDLHILFMRPFDRKAFQWIFKKLISKKTKDAF